MEGGESKFSAFPFKPYSIQIDFMNALYRSLDKGGVAMLESPTGTGKTLSIICSALQWLVDRKKQPKPKTGTDSVQNPGSRDGSVSDDEPDWIRDFVINKNDQEQETKTKKLGIGSGRFDKRSSKGNTRDILSKSGEEEDFWKEKDHEKRSKKREVVELNEEDEFLVEDYESDEEGVDEGKFKRKACGGSLNSSSDEGEEDELKNEEEGLKVYFCSRTHSQLSQFVKELRRTAFAAELKIICLGSRKNFCINEEVLKLGNSGRINERCMELQKNKNQEISKTKVLREGGRIRRTKSSCGCPMLKKHKLQNQFRSEIAQQGALDIEDLAHLGRRIGTCPYYGSRSMVPLANLIVLPYQSLLLKSSRESLGLNLKDSIVIIDEAHNLADSLTSMYDSKITLSQLEQVHTHLELYLNRFRNLLGAGNRRYIQTLMVLTRSFLRVLLDNKVVRSVDPCHDTEKGCGEGGFIYSSMAVNDFLFSLDVDNINLVKVQQYIKESNIIHKVSGYGAKVASMQRGSMLDDGGKGGEEGSTLSGFQALADLLLSLKNKDGDGRIIIARRRSMSHGQQEGYIKYIMLAGEKIFYEIMDQAHAIVLTGGTLQPIEETRVRLFPWLLPDQFHFFSCNHIIPRESILPIAVSHGPSGMSFDFSYSSRSSPKMIEELGRLLCNLVTVVPEGIVVFFSSFEYEGQVYDAWNSSGILSRIMKKKRVFRELRNNADVELVLKNYKETINTLSSGSREEDQPVYTGAILLAVVGGKISEGINFSDGMGRCVVMVGLPYPSPSDIELMERVKHIEELGNSNFNKAPELSLGNGYRNGDNTQKPAFDILRSCKGKGREYYENICMKAVNQSIGRAIRHINDYAAILLVDSRYASDPSRSSSRPTNKLPQWIKDGLVSATDNYGEVHRLLHQFFKFNKKRGN